MISGRKAIPINLIDPKSSGLTPVSTTQQKYFFAQPLYSLKLSTFWAPGVNEISALARSLMPLLCALDHMVLIKCRTGLGLICLWVGGWGFLVVDGGTKIYVHTSSLKDYDLIVSSRRISKYTQEKLHYTWALLPCHVHTYICIHIFNQPKCQYRFPSQCDKCKSFSSHLLSSCFLLCIISASHSRQRSCFSISHHIQFLVLSAELLPPSHHNI